MRMRTRRGTENKGIDPATLPPGRNGYLIKDGVVAARVTHYRGTPEDGETFVELADDIPIGQPFPWPRAQRDALLTASDHTQAPDYPLTPDKRAEWAAYRQALRELPKTQPNPLAVVWPVPPA